jgi:hypothetical protein
MLSRTYKKYNMLSTIIIPLLLIVLFSALLYICILGIKDADEDTYNVDLMDPRHMKRIMDRYFLLGFVIVDESQELCYFIFDGERDYQALSFKGLERDNNNKNDFKDIYKMINSGRL